jgi:Fur family ferric uptake transcriptional regulator
MIRGYRLISSPRPGSGLAGASTLVSLGGGPRSWDGTHHHHIVCRQCAAVTEVDCEAGHGPCLEPAAGAWSLAGEAEVTFWGLCAGCPAAIRAAASRRAHRPSSSRRASPVTEPQAGSGGSR